MPAYFLDTSALIKYYHEEKGSDRVKEIIDAAAGKKAEKREDEHGKVQIYISELSVVEFRSTLFKKFRMGTITAEDRIGTVNLFDSDILGGKFSIIPIESAHLQRAIGLLEDYADQFALRTLDSLQLATALAIREGLKEAVEFVCADQTSIEIAEKCGLIALNPEK